MVESSDVSLKLEAIRKRQHMAAFALSSAMTNLQVAQARLAVAARLHAEALSLSNMAPNELDLREAGAELGALKRPKQSNLHVVGGDSEA